jgi:hypothetical protein
MSMHEKKPEGAETLSAALEVQASFRNTKFIPVFTRPTHWPITLVNTQNVSVTKIVDTSSIQCAESKYGLRSQFLALVVMIHVHELWLLA